MRVFSIPQYASSEMCSAVVSSSVWDVGLVYSAVVSWSHYEIWGLVYPTVVSFFFYFIFFHTAAVSLNLIDVFCLYCSCLITFLWETFFILQWSHQVSEMGFACTAVVSSSPNEIYGFCLYRGGAFWDLGFSEPCNGPWSLMREVFVYPAVVSSSPYEMWVFTYCSSLIRSRSVGFVYAAVVSSGLWEIWVLFTVEWNPKIIQHCVYCGQSLSTASSHTLLAKTPAIEIYRKQERQSPNVFTFTFSFDRESNGFKCTSNLTESCLLSGTGSLYHHLPNSNCKVSFISVDFCDLIFAVRSLTTIWCFCVFTKCWNQTCS